MRMFFCAEQACALFVNGAYLGVADGFWRAVELDPADRPFCECKAAGYAPVRFVADEDLLFAPPPGIELYFCRGDVCIRLCDFFRADPALRVLWQKRLGNALLTLCLQGRLTLNLETPQGFFPIPLPFCMQQSVPSRAGGLFLLESEEAFALIREDGAVCALSEGRITQRGDTVCAEVPLHDSRGSVVRRRYEHGVLKESVPVAARGDADETPLAFFEALLAGEDVTRRMAPSLASKNRLLSKFLGNFERAVVLEEEDVIGLVYARKARVFDVRPFRVTTEAGRVTNIVQI